MAPQNNTSLYRIQAAILDILASLGYPDKDGFAAELADLYLARRSSLDANKFLLRASAIRTGTFARRRRDRGQVTALIVERLDKRFLPFLRTWKTTLAATSHERKKVRTLTAATRAAPKPAASFHALMLEFRRAIQLHAVHEFWVSRKKAQLRSRPEALAQFALAMFLDQPVRERPGFLLREVRAGTGYIDVLAVAGPSRRFLVELKVLRGGAERGKRQLAKYLDLNTLAEGWLLFLDARPFKTRQPLQDATHTVDGKLIRQIVIDINPPPPSSLE